MTAQQLKNSILQMAVQGKLVPQDPNDEPASVLLERIRAEKEQLIKQGKIKKEKNPSFIFKGADNIPYEKVGTTEPVSLEAEVQFEIPDSWEWVRLIDVCEYIQRGKSPKYSPIQKYPVIAQKCNQWSGFSIEKAQFIEPSSIASYGQERILQDEDLLWNSTGLGTLGRMAIYRTHLNPYELAVADSHVTVIRPLKAFVLPQYLYYYFANPTVQSVIEDKADGTTKQKELATATVKTYLVPVPPLEEQRRIIAKISEVLPALKEYDEVEKKNTTLNQSFPERLKKSILQMAVQGKLVPQDPADEPAEVLLARIREEKQRLVKEGKIKKDKQESVIFRRDNSHYEKLNGIERCIDDEIPFEIPDNWDWVRLGDLFYHNTGKALNSSNTAGTKLTYITTSNLYWDRFEIDELKEMRFTDAEIEKCTITKGDLLVCEGGDIGRAAIWDFDFDMRIQNHIHRLRSYYPVCIRFYYYVFYLYKNAGLIGGKGIGIQGLSSNALHSLLFPLPPLAEQYRIIIGIEHLLPFCEQL